MLRTPVFALRAAGRTHVAGAAAALPLACHAAAAGTSRGSASDVLMLPILLAFAVGLHAALARVAKAVLASARPLATGEPEACGYDRSVHATAAPQTMGIVAVALGAGLALWLGHVSGSTALWALGWLGVAAAVALDLWWWERVAASANYLWFQRGWSGRVHQVLIDNIRDIEVAENEAGGFTLRHGRGNADCRLLLRLEDGGRVALPKTDAHGGLEAVEAVANHVRARRQQSSDKRSLAEAQARAGQAAAEAAQAMPSRDAAMLLELRRLRQKALAPELPPAVPPAAPRGD